MLLLKSLVGALHKYNIKVIEFWIVKKVYFGYLYFSLIIIILRNLCGYISISNTWILPLSVRTISRDSILQDGTIIVRVRHFS